MQIECSASPGNLLHFTLINSADYLFDCPNYATPQPLLELMTINSCDICPSDEFPRSPQDKHWVNDPFQQTTSAGSSDKCRTTLILNKEINSESPVLPEVRHNRIGNSRISETQRLCNVVQEAESGGKKRSSLLKNEDNGLYLSAKIELGEFKISKNAFDPIACLYTADVMDSSDIQDEEVCLTLTEDPLWEVKNKALLKSVNKQIAPADGSEKYLLKIVSTTGIPDSRETQAEETLTKDDFCQVKSLAQCAPPSDEAIIRDLRSGKKPTTDTLLIIKDFTDHQFAVKAQSLLSHAKSLGVKGEDTARLVHTPSSQPVVARKVTSPRTATSIALSSSSSLLSGHRSGRGSCEVPAVARRSELVPTDVRQDVDHSALSSRQRGTTMT